MSLLHGLIPPMEHRAFRSLLGPGTVGVTFGWTGEIGYVELPVDGRKGRKNAAP